LPVVELKAKIAEKTNVPSNMQRVIFKGKVLHDDKDLSFYCILFLLLDIYYRLYKIDCYIAVQDGHALHMVERPAQPSMYTRKYLYEK